MTQELLLIIEKVSSSNLALDPHFTSDLVRKKTEQSLNGFGPMALLSLI